LHGLEVALEAIESVFPQAPVRRDPCIDLAESIRPKPVHTPLGIDADVDKAGIAEHAEVLRDRGLAHGQLLDELPDGPFAIAQQVEDAAAVRFSQELEGGDHGSSMPDGLYARQAMYIRMRSAPD
jgi:hypothetical protein